jgi:hypothetical protein
MEDWFLLLLLLFNPFKKSGMQATLEGLSSFIPMSEASYSKSPNLEKEFKLGQNV